MIVMVTGGAGFIGSHLVRRLQQNPAMKIIVLDKLTYAGDEQRIQLRNGDVLAVDDIANRRSVRAILESHRPDVVVHMAAETHVTRSIETSQEFIDTNIVGTFALLDECLQARTSRFIYVSTDEVYGSLLPGMPPWTEASPLRPNNPYSASKAAGECLVRSWWKTFNFPAIVTHSSNNYGPDQHREKLIPAIIAAAIEGTPVRIHGDGDQLRDWMHVDDHVDGLVRVVERGEVGQVYNFAGDCERTVNEIVTIVLSRLHGKLFSGSPVMVEWVSDRPGNDRRYAMTYSHVMDKLGWKPGAEIEERIGAVIDSYLETANV